MSRRAVRRAFLRVTMPALFVVAVTAAVLLVRSGLRESATEVAPAAAQQKRPTPTPQRPLYYSIRSGDTLDLIARRFGTTVNRLLELNPGIDPQLLRPGQRIRVR